MSLLPPPSIESWSFGQYPSCCIERLHIGSSLLDVLSLFFFFLHNNVQVMLVLHVGHTHTHFDCCMDLRKVIALLPYLKILLI